MKKTYSLITLITAILCFTFCGCSLPRYNNKDKTSKTKVTEMTELTERQKKVLESEGLPTDIDKLSYQQKSGIIHIEKAFEYLDDKYPGVEFEYLSHRPEAIMGKEKTDFVPKGYDKDDSRNIITVEKDRKGNYNDRNGYMLIAVRETMEKVITKYVKAYFGEGNVKVYIHPYLTEMEYGDEINENTVKDKVKSTAVLFVPDEVCNETQLDAFSYTYKDDGHDFECRFRATIIKKEDFDDLTYINHGDMYDREHIIYDIDIK